MNIKIVQQTLNRQGFGPLGVDGVAGPKTVSAITAFQQKKGILATGHMDPVTFAQMFPPVVINGSTLKDRAEQYALSKEGVMEATGQNDGPEVETFLASVGLGKGFSWCMAFMYWCTNRAAIDLGIKNPLVRTGGVLEQWHRFTGQKIDAHDGVAKIGDIFIIDHGGGHGHTGMITDVFIGGKVDTIEGNTNTDHSANGNGVYQLERNTKDFLGLIRIN